MPDGSIPGTNDGDVVIINHEVTYNLLADDMVTAITIENSASNSANLIVRDLFTLTASGGIVITGNDFTTHSELTVISGSTVSTNGIIVNNLNTNDNGTDGYRTQIEVNGATLNVNGDLIYERTASPNLASDGISEIIIGNSVFATLTVSGELLLKRSADTRCEVEMVIRSSSTVNLGSLALETTSSASNDGDISFELESGQVTVSGETSMVFNSLNNTSQKQIIDITGGTFTTKTFLMEVQNTPDGTINTNFLSISSGTFSVEDQITINQDLIAAGNSENRIDLMGGKLAIGVDGLTAGLYSTNYPSVGNERQIIDFNSLTTGTLELAGNNTQAVPPARNYFAGNIIVNNTSGVEVNLRDDLDIYGVITMEKGVLNKNGKNLILQDGASGAVGTDVSSYIDGSLAKLGTGNTVFPVGDNGVRGVIEISSLNDITDMIEVQYTRGDAGITDYGATADASKIEYWEMQATEGGTTNTINVKLNWDDGGIYGSHIPDDLGITNDLFPSYVDAGTWTAMSSPLFSGDNTTAGFTSGDISTDKLDDGSFIITTFGTSTTDSFLPVELIQFQGKVEDEGIFLEWTTASELNNAFFTIEKSINGIHFESVGQVVGKGTTATSSYYHFVDSNTKPGIHTYRLKQTDFDGVNEILGEIVIQYEEKNLLDIALYPNPVKAAEELEVIVPVTDSGENIKISVYNLEGHLMENEEFQPQTGENGKFQLPIDIGLISGTYVLYIEVAGEITVKRFTVID